MIRKIEIENFKSIKKLELELGRVTVLIGANGAGKSNILEGIAFVSAAAANKLDNEFLVSRGIRMPEDSHLVISSFKDDTKNDALNINITWDDLSYISYVILAPNYDYSTWRSGYSVKSDESQDSISSITFGGHLLSLLREASKPSLWESAGKQDPSDSLRLIELLTAIKKSYDSIEANEHFVRFGAMFSFLIYAPENRELRTFAEEGQILPLGIRGEGLFRLLKILSQKDGGAKLAILKEKLKLIDWFEDFEFQQDAMAYERRLLIRDRHLSDDLAYFDQRSANEGFLFLLFYFCLFLSDATPPFFAIDNIDSSLNPKLCAQLVRELVKMAADNGKQAILTTHNPAVLDGLDLNDPEQKLYVVRRNMDGETVVSPVAAPKVEAGQEPVPLSEAFLRGYLGGLPTNF